MSPANIVVEGLTKSFRVAERRTGALGGLTSLFARRYRTVTALNGIAFALGEGELLGLIGPNGAGKSTTIKILCGILEPTAGRCEVADPAVRQDNHCLQPRCIRPGECA